MAYERVKMDGEREKNIKIVQNEKNAKKLMGKTDKKIENDPKAIRDKSRKTSIKGPFNSHRPSIKRPSNKLALLLLFMLLAVHSFFPHQALAETEDKLQKITRFIEEQQSISKIPGLSVVLVEKGETILQQGFGLADIQSQKPVTSETLFEIGSTTKAFTALAILQLEEQGLLHRSDDVSSYIPWLKLRYKGEPQNITLNQLLHHTSGIPYDSIALIPETNAENALEATVKTLLEKPLNRLPGSSYEYATINYDVLGLVIETVSKMPFDQYVKQFILEPLEMADTYVGLHQLNESNSPKMAAGYKIGFMQPRVLESPVYRGNTPAGYLITNAEDIAKWLKLQAGGKDSNVFNPDILRASHIADETVKPLAPDSYYAAGWVVENRNGISYISHAGQNPNFSSHIVLKPDEQVGVAVLANMNSTFPAAIAEGVMRIWEDQAVPAPHTDFYLILDQILTVANVIIVCLGATGFILIAVMCKKLASRKRKWTRATPARTILFSLLTLSLVAVVIMAPQLVLGVGGLPLPVINVWTPVSVVVTLYSVLAACILAWICRLFFLFTRNAQKR